MTSKLGPHGIRATPPTLAWASVAPIAKALDNVAILQAAPPTALRIFRHGVTNEADTSDPIGTVERCIAALAGYQHPRLLLQLWCGAHPTRAQLTAAVAHCHARGYATCGSSHFTGDYTQADWDYEEASGQDYHGHQGYWGNQGFTVWHALRHRQFWKTGNKPVLILEAGRDAVEGGQAGWKISGDSADQYLAELRAYDQELAKDVYVLGSTIFSAGPTPDWENFDVDPLIPQLLAGGQPMPPTPPSPTYNVGAGVLALMATKGDHPLSDEHYTADTTGTVFASETFGAKGIYRWNKQANMTVFIPFS